MLGDLAYTQIGLGGLVTLAVLMLWTDRLITRSAHLRELKHAERDAATWQVIAERETERGDRLEGLLQVAVDGPVKITAAMVSELRAAAQTGPPS